MSSLRLSKPGGVRVLSFENPILSLAVLSELFHLLLELHREPGPLIIASDHPSIFLAGAHLAEISELDSRTSHGYGERGRQVLDQLGAHPGPVLAAVDGTCSGGGFDLVLSCDLVVASQAARFSHPGVRRGLVTGWGGTQLLPQAIGGSAARSALLQAGLLTGRDIGAVAVHPADADVRIEAVRAALRLAALHPSRLTLFRHLRHGRFVDRFRSVVVHTRGEKSVLDP